MRIAVLGGTGKLGSGLAVRWARAGHEVSIGSRDAGRAATRAVELSRAHGAALEGVANEVAAGRADAAVLTVPYEAHRATLEAVRPALRGKVLVDTTVPLRPPRVSRVELPPGGAAALEAQALFGSEAAVAAAFHHVSAAHLSDPAHPVDCDVLVVADDPRAKSTALALVADLGLRGLDGGALANAVALESLTPVLIHLNRTYKSTGAGIVFTNLPAPAARGSGGR